MRLYVIAILVALLGLLAANQVQAEELCGLRSERVLGVERWMAMPDAAGKVLYTVSLVSKDSKSISAVGGSVAFFSGSTMITSVPIVLDHIVKPNERFELALKRVEGASGGDIIGNNQPTITALACVSDISYADGSGVIIN